MLESILSTELIKLSFVVTVLIAAVLVGGAAALSFYYYRHDYEAINWIEKEFARRESERRAVKLRGESEKF